MVNVIVDEVVWQTYRRVARESGGLMIRGMLEHTEDGVVNVIAERIEKLDLGLRTSPATSAEGCRESAVARSCRVERTAVPAVRASLCARQQLNQ